MFEADLLHIFNAIDTKADHVILIATCKTEPTCSEVKEHPTESGRFTEELTPAGMGVCAKQSANGIQFPTDSLPTPAAFFPLSDYSAQSWPLGDKAFFNTSSTTVGWSQDQTFGNVVNCPVRCAAYSRARISLLRGESPYTGFTPAVQ